MATEDPSTVENPWKVLAKTGGKHIARHTHHGGSTSTVSKASSTLPKDSAHSTDSVDSFSNEPGVANDEPPVNRWKAMAKAQTEQRKNTLTLKPGSAHSTADNTRGETRLIDRSVLSLSHHQRDRSVQTSINKSPTSNDASTKKPTTENATIDTGEIVNNPWKAMSKRSLHKDDTISEPKSIEKNNEKPAFLYKKLSGSKPAENDIHKPSFLPKKLEGALKQKALSVSEASLDEDVRSSFLPKKLGGFQRETFSASNLAETGNGKPSFMPNNIYNASSLSESNAKYDGEKKSSIDKESTPLNSLQVAKESENAVNPWKVKAGIRKASHPQNNSLLSEKAQRMAFGKQKDISVAEPSVTPRQNYNRWKTMDTDASKPISKSIKTEHVSPSSTFFGRRRTPTASKSHDDILTVTSHTTTDRPSRRAQLVRGNSTACIMDSESEKKGKAPLNESASQGVSKVRKTVKALEFSHMLTDEDMVNLLDRAHKEITGDTAKQTEFGTSKGVAALVKVLKKYEDNVEVLEACFLLIADLAQVEINRDALALNGVIEVILISMLKSEHDLLIQEYGCYAIASLAQNRKYQEWIVQSNGIEVIQTTQEAFTSNAKIQTACLSALQNLALGNTDNAFATVAKGMIRSVMAVVKKPENRRDFALHKEACATVATLARTIDSNRSAIAKAGGIDTTVQALKTFPTNAELQRIGLDALCTLIVGHSHNADTIVELDGVHMLIQTLRVYEDDLNVSITGLRFAKFLTEFDHISRKFTGEGGLKVVLSSMRTHENSMEIQREGCSILCNLALQHDSKELICTSGGIKMIVLAMKRLTSDSLLQKNGVKALDSLATNDENKRNIAAGGGITATLTAMKNHSDIPALQGLAAGALRKLATIGRNRSIMNENDAITIVAAAMESNPNHTYLQQNGKKLLVLLDPSRVEAED